MWRNWEIADGRWKGVTGEVRAAGGEGRAARPWLGDAVAYVLRKGCGSVEVMNERVVTWERAGTTSQFSWIFLANTMDLAE